MFKHLFRRYLSIALVLALVLFASFGSLDDAAAAGETDLGRAIAAQEAHTDALMAIDGVVGTAVAVGAAQAAVLTGASTAGGAAAAAGGVVLLAPVLVVGGIVRGVNNSKVGKRIESRHTAVPAAVKADGIRQLDLFFPLAPSPQRVEIAYVSASGEGVLIIETTEALNGLHLVPGTL